MLEHVFVELGKPTIRPKDSQEERSESFAMLCRMQAVVKDAPIVFEMIENVEKKWRDILHMPYA
jgi:hypothetical protein